MEQDHPTAIIYVASHKDFSAPKDSLYVPIQVGRKLSDHRLGYFSDDTGDEISSLNPYYCELTALYWMWKNDNHDIRGLVHYRRYFFNRDWKLLTESDVRKLLPEHGMIVAQRGYNLESVRKRYAKHHVASDLEVTRKILANYFPSYVDAFDVVMNGKSYCPYNMLIAEKTVLDLYCSWLFSILEDVRKELGESLYTRTVYDQRVLGFLGERLLNVYLQANPDVPFVEVPVLNIEGNIPAQKMASRIKALL
jgi:hypothetical protein